MKNLYTYLIFYLAFGFTACNSSSNNEKEFSEDTGPSLFQLLYEKENLSIVLKTDIQKLLDNKYLDTKEYQKATFIGSSDGIEITSGKIHIRPRGVTRKENCDFPPIMIKVKKSRQDSLGVGSSENIKLVTYCKDSINYPEWIVKEYLAYKLYNAISEHSFQVKLVEVTYEDSKGQYPTLQKKGFIIEPLEELANRYSCNIVPDEQAIASIHKEKYKLLTVFQFMIGNSDWNFSKRHNVRMLACQKSSSPIPVPYDFDYSGMVNADYAKPHPMLPIKKVTERLFQWRGSVDEDFSETIKVFQESKNKFQEIYENVPYLSSETKVEMTDYFDQFYKTVSSAENIKTEIRKARISK